MSILGLLAAPRPLFPGFCSLFPRLAFPKGGLTALVLAGARARPGGRGGEAGPGGGRFVYPARHYVIAERLVPDPGLRAPSSAALPGAESGVEDREEDGKEKLDKQVFPLWVFPQNVLGLQTSWAMFSCSKIKELPCFSLTSTPAWMRVAVSRGFLHIP